MKNKVEVEQPKSEVSNTNEVATEKRAVTPVNSRLYNLISEPSLPSRGKQRIAVLSVLRAAKEPMTPEQIEPLATAAGLSAIGGNLASVRYHLHQLKLMGHVEEIQPTVVKTEAA